MIPATSLIPSPPNGLTGAPAQPAPPLAGAALGPGFLVTLSVLLAFLCAPSHGLIRTVGPTGDFTSIDDAVNDLREFPDEGHEIRLSTGLHRSVLTLPGIRDLTITGGWASDFTFRVEDPSATTLAMDDYPNFHLFECKTNGSLVVSNLTFDGEDSDRRFAWAVLRDSCKIELRDVVIRGYRKQCTEVGPTYGLLQTFFWVDRGYRFTYEPGITSGEPLFRLRGVRIEGNRVGCGRLMRSISKGPHRLEISGTQIVDNRLDAFPPSPEWDFDGSIVEISNGGGKVLLEDLEIEKNRIVSPGVDHQIRYVQYSSYGLLPRLDAQRLPIHGEDTLGPLVNLLVKDGRASMSDTLLTGGGDLALAAFAERGAEVRLTNLTAAQNRYGLRLDTEDGGFIALRNSIVARNQSDTVEHYGVNVLVNRDNWVGGDPIFVDPLDGDFRLRLDSPAINQGRLTARYDLDLLDLDRLPRLEGADVDLGAYEARIAGPTRGGPPCVASAYDDGEVSDLLCYCTRGSTSSPTQCTLETPEGPFGFVFDELSGLVPTSASWNATTSFATNNWVQTGTKLTTLEPSDAQWGSKLWTAPLQLPPVGAKEGAVLHSQLELKNSKTGETLGLEVLIDLVAAQKSK